MYHGNRLWVSRVFIKCDARSTLCQCLVCLSIRPSVCSAYNSWTGRSKFFWFSSIYSLGQEYLPESRWANYVTFDIVKFCKAQKLSCHAHVLIRVFQNIQGDTSQHVRNTYHSILSAWPDYIATSTPCFISVRNTKMRKNKTTIVGGSNFPFSIIVLVRMCVTVTKLFGFSTQLFFGQNVFFMTGSFVIKSIFFEVFCTCFFQDMITKG